MRRHGFPGLADLAFYRHKQPLPAWAIGLEQRPAYIEAVAESDILVNAHAGVRPTHGEIAVHNLLAILRSKRRRGEQLDVALARIAENPECLIHPEKRAAFARKWARRMAPEDFETDLLRIARKEGPKAVAFAKRLLAAKPPTEDT